MYSLDFETMMQVMQEHQKTGLLHADVPSRVVSMREACRIEIKLTAGAVVSCAIIGTSGRRLTGKEAIRELSRLGRLFWNFTPELEVVVPLVSSVVTHAFFPLRTVHLEQWQMGDWPRIHRMVFALADGTKSAAKIAEVLSSSQSLVDKALHDLQSISVIAMVPQNMS